MYEKITLFLITMKNPVVIMVFVQPYEQQCLLALEIDIG